MLRFIAKVICAASLPACVGFHSLGMTRPSNPPAVRPCAAGSTEYQLAWRQLRKIDQEIERLNADGDPSPITAEIRRLGESSCFALGGSVYVAEGSKPDSGLSLTTFWNEGGREYVLGYLNLASSSERWLFPAPSWRRTSARETRPRHPLRDFYCPIADAGCVAFSPPIEVRPYAPSVLRRRKECVGCKLFLYLVRTNTPVYAEVETSIYRSVADEFIYRHRRVWLLGFWVPVFDGLVGVT